MKPGSEALRGLPVVGECSDDLLGRLNEASDLVRVGPDEELFREGEILQELTFLVVGQVGAVHPQPGGKQTMLDVLQPVRPLCLAATLLGLPAPAGARTFTSARLIVFPVAALQAMIRDDTALGQRLLDYSLHETQVLTQEVYALKLRSAVQRLAVYLLGRVNEAELSPARFVLPFEKRMLAARIGCSQENLSRAFAALRRIGVETQRGVVLIRDLTALRTFAAPITREGTK
ncbi:MAG TPA: helix-turn-helix domain-containing protein [Acetobacteraceae bacterium]|nr:helix-turn-helix domain-containing protein [Acetobacteraceae bacterium]